MAVIATVEALAEHCGRDFFFTVVVVANARAVSGGDPEVIGMVTPNEVAVYQQLTDLLAGRLAFDDFNRWLLAMQRAVPATDPARPVLFRVIAKLDEYDSSTMTDEQLRRYLVAILPEDVRHTVSPKIQTPGRPLTA